MKTTKEVQSHNAEMKRRELKAAARFSKNRQAAWEAADRLEYLRRELRAGRISYGELAELESLAEHIAPCDVELLEAAGVPEHPPGPWTVGLYVSNDYEPAYFPVERDERDADGFKKDVVPLIAKSIYGATVEDKLANARLLASAPELLTALENLVELFGELHTPNRYTADRKARAVIARAKN